MLDESIVMVAGTVEVTKPVREPGEAMIIGGLSGITTPVVGATEEILEVRVFNV